jgi:hypothetical protein
MTTLPDSTVIGPDALTISPTTLRREVLAGYLALPAAVRPSSALLAGYLGCDSSTVRGDWRRVDVQARADALSLAGLAAVLLACARAGIVVIARRAAAGDLDALAFVVDRLGALGLGDALLDPLAPTVEGQGARVAGGAFGTAEALAALHEAQRAVAEAGTREE